MEPLRREVMVPVPSYRRPSSLIGISIVLVLLASAVDAVVWTYQTTRALDEIGSVDATDIPTLSHTDAAAVRARALETELARAADELRQIDERVLERLREMEGDTPLGDLLRRGDQRLDDSLVTVDRCDPSDPLCGVE